MIHSIEHRQIRAWHYLDVVRHRRSWLIVAGASTVVVLLMVAGYFSTVPWDVLMSAVIHTTYRLLIAYGIALLIGVPIALLVGWSPLAEMFFPIFDILQNIPSFALIPFFIYFFKLTDTMIILFAVSSIVWPILFAVLTAIKSAPRDLNDAATVFGARGFRRVFSYLAPLSLPAILTGSIVGIAIGWEAVIGAEIIVHASGFGSFIKDSATSGIDRPAVAGMFVILVLVFTLNRLVWAPLLAESGKRYAK
jgi:NitT/TauT family transport system permease protein